MAERPPRFIPQKINGDPMELVDSLMIGLRQEVLAISYFPYFSLLQI